MSRRYHVFVNSDAGSVGEADKSMGEIADAFRRADVEVDVAALDPEGLPAAMLEAWRPGIEAIREAIRRQRGWGKIRAAPVAIVHTLRRLPVHHVRLTIDGSGPEKVATPLLFVGNGLFDRHGERLGTRTSLQDHRLGVYVIATKSGWRLVANAIKARLGGIDAAAQTGRRAAESLVVDSDESSLAIALDGEPTDLRVPLTFRSRAGALHVLATPAQAPDTD